MDTESKENTESNEPDKESYETSDQVQLWLRQQRQEVGEDTADFNPRLLASHHERSWILSSLSAFHRMGLITDVVSAVKPGIGSGLLREAARALKGRGAASMFAPMVPLPFYEANGWHLDRRFVALTRTV